MNRIKPLDPADFSRLIQQAPLVSIDLIVQNDQAQVLLGRRRNAPAKGYWFTPGGRIRKGETIPQALSRIVRAELGVDGKAHAHKFLGVYDHLYEDNVFEDPSYGTHYVTLAHQIEVEVILGDLPGDEHSDYRWWGLDELRASPEVHPYAKAYF